MGHRKGSMNHSKHRKVQGLKFGSYRLDFVKFPDNVYAVHISCDAENGFGLGSGFISMSLNTWDELINENGMNECGTV